MINEEIIRTTPAKVTNGYRVVIINANANDDMAISDYRSLSSAFFYAGFDFSRLNGTICKIYRIQKNVVTTLKHSYVQLYGNVY